MEPISLNKEKNDTVQNTVSANENIRKPNKIQTIILWYFTIAFFCSGFGIISAGSFLSGIVWIGGGFLLCPKIQKEMKVKYKIAGTIILFLIGCAFAETSSDSEISEEKQMIPESQNVNSDEDASLVETGEKQKELDKLMEEEKEKQKEEPEEQKSLTKKEQTEYINGVLTEFERTGKVPAIDKAELCEEKNVFDCIYKKMQKEVEEGITKYTVGECLKYQEVYENWYPDGENMEIFETLNNKYNNLKDKNKKIEEYDREYANGIEYAYDKILESFYCDFYVQNKLKEGILSSVISKISGDDYIYYYANDVVYDELFQDYYKGEEEYLICIDVPLKKAGAQSVFGYFTGSYETITESGGFERDLPVFHAYTDENMQKIERDYEEYLEAEEEVLKCQKNIGKVLQVDFFDESEENNAVLSGGQEEYICPDSDTKKLTKNEVLSLSKKERWIAKNEIYARYGRMFNNEELQEYFNSTSWYVGIIEPDDFDESIFSKVEKANIKLLAKYE